MSSNVRSRNKAMNIEQEKNSQQSIAKEHFPKNLFLHNVNERITNINSLNISCFGGDEKKKAIKNQKNTPNMIKEIVGHTQALADPMEASDHKIEHVLQQRGAKIDIDDDIKDLFGKKEITKAIINQLVQRALTGSMNSSNDDPPRLCTKKHVRY